MATTFTLDSIREAAEAKYGETVIDLGDGRTATLVNPLRLPKGKREALLMIEKNEDIDQGQALEDAIALCAKGDGDARRLLEAADGDLAILATIFEQYQGATQAGEASASRN